MSAVAPDLIAGYLEELYAGLRVPAAEAELIAAEAEDHLRETAEAGIAIGMTELEAQQAAISSFGPIRAVVRAHRRRAVTAGGGRQRRPGAGQPEPLPAVAPGQPLEQGDGPTGVGDGPGGVAGVEL